MGSLRICSKDPRRARWDMLRQLLKQARRFDRWSWPADTERSIIYRETWATRQARGNLFQELSDLACSQ